MKKSYRILEQELFDLRAQLSHTYNLSYKKLSDASQDKLYASGVVLQLTALGGREIIPPVLIRDGLTLETINQLRYEIERSSKELLRLFTITPIILKKPE
tara:strand:- start:3119 stop:3418 length:300 start_codon:yes stop_codon:yes gene_type:complete